MSFKINSIFLFVLYFVTIASSHLDADTFDDENFIESFTVGNENVSLKPSFVTHQSEDGDVIDFLNGLKTCGANIQWNPGTLCRVSTLDVNVSGAEEKGASKIGTMVLQEIFYQEDSKKYSSLLIFKNFTISEQYQGKGKGRAALSLFLKTLDELDSSKISHDLYARLGSNSPGVFKMYLDSGLNYYVNNKNNEIYESNKIYNSDQLNRINIQLSSSFTKKDVPTCCLLRREPGGERRYSPYFFDL